jgi:hypothetical protein
MAQGPEWERVQSVLDEFIRTSRKHAEDLVGALRREVQRQADALGLATKDDVSRLERRVREAEQGRPASGEKTAKDAAKKAPVKGRARPKKPSDAS